MLPIQQLQELIQGKKVAFIGAGVSHKRCIEQFVELGAQVTLCDQKKSLDDFGDYADTLRRLKVNLSLGEHYTDGFAGQDIIMRTPGYEYYKPELQAALKAGAMVTSEVELFFEFCPCEIVAVTGSDGKTTTTTLISKMFEAAGRKVFLGGNIGAALLPQLADVTPDAVAVVKAGASVIHIHVRDDEGKNTMETERFCYVVNLVREELAKANLDAVLNLTSSGSKFSEDMRLAHLPILKPEMCSYDPGSMNWANSYIFLNTPPFLERLGLLTQELDIKPEIEIFDAGMLGNVDYYLKKGVLKAPLHYQLVLDVPGGMPGNIDSINHLVSKLPEGSTWSITGIGKAHMPCMLAGLAAGCDNLRVGLEDNVFMKKGEYATNAQLVERAVKLGILAGREIATAAEAREILGIKPEKGVLYQP